MKSKVIVDGDGTLIFQGIHDAVVDSFRFVSGASFDITFAQEGASKVRVNLDGVSRIGFSEVVNGMIIDRIYSWPLEELKFDSIDKCDAWRVLLGGNCSDDDLPSVANRIASAHPNGYLVHFTTSYGGSIAAVCSSVKVRKLE